MFKKIIFTVLLLIAHPCFAADHYCDLILSGDGAGTSGDPWQWSQAEDSGNVSAGDTVYLRGTGGSITLTTNSDANGSAGSQIVYKQWPGETQAQFTSITIDGTSTPFYEFNGLKIDAGTGTTWVTAFTESWSGTGSGELTFQDCTIHGFRSTSYSGGDYYPYYVRTDSGTGPYENNYVFSFIDADGITLEINDCTFQHGGRILHITSTAATAITVSGCTFDRWGEDAINISSSSNVTITGCTFEGTAAGSPYYFVYSWPGTATGTWSGHEGETVTQATSSSSGIFVGLYNSRWWIVVDDSGNIPSRAISYVWSLDSDSSNIYWTPSGNGDSTHVDRISIGPAASNITVTKNLFSGRLATVTGNGVKVTGETSSNILISNNIFDDYKGFYTLYLEPVVDVTIVNNILALESGETDSYSMRLLNTPGSWGNAYIYNNIITGCLDQSGGALSADYNIVRAATLGGGANDIVSQDWSDSPSGNNRYFIDYANGDYRPYDADSPQIDAGSATYAPSDDYLGASRPQGSGDDIGPYEYRTATMMGVSINAP